MLSGVGLDGRQTFEYDIESLLYVVLYCALLWLPHHLSQAHLKTTIEVVFEESEWSPIHKALLGGAGKLANAVTRHFTGGAKCTLPLQNWLDTVMDHCGPTDLPHTHGRDTSRWSPEQLDAFWADLLQTETLETDDRVYNDHPLARDNREPQFGLDSTEAIVLGKRASEERDLGGPEPAQVKRLREGKPLTAKVIDRPSRLEQPRRRSERIAAMHRPPLSIAPRNAEIARRSTRHRRGR